ncbi:MAG: serine hydrolase [Acidimicrobiales bacterium]
MSGIRDSGAEEAHELDSLSELCEQLVGPHALATSLVMATHVHDTETDLAFGANVGREVEPTDLCELHCLAKPIVAWSLLESASAHGFDPSAPASSLLPDADHLDESVTVVGICNHLTRLAQPAALDWVSRPTHARPGIRSLRQEPDGAWYSEVGSWIVATALINALTGQPTLDVVSGLIERCDADAYIGTDPPPGRRVLVPIAGLPTRAIPMLHVDHPSYRSAAFDPSSVALGR